MPLLLIPLLVLGVIALWALLLPLSLLQRYRTGKARRRAWPPGVRINAWLLLASAALFLLGAWIGGRWIEAAAGHALVGLACGVLLGIVGLWLTRFERNAQGLHYTPNAWLVLALTLLVLARIALGVWQALERWTARVPLPELLAGHASLFAVGGLLLGYYLAYTWGLKRRLG